MDRNAFKMNLSHGCKEEHKKRHDEIWPELKLFLKEFGISDYSIFIDNETNSSFAVQKQYEGNPSQDSSNNPIVKRWWSTMTDVIETNEDFLPVVPPLKEVFHLD